MMAARGSKRTGVLVWMISKSRIRCCGLSMTCGVCVIECRTTEYESEGSQRMNASRRSADFSLNGIPSDNSGAPIILERKMRMKAADFRFVISWPPHLVEMDA